LPQRSMRSIDLPRQGGKRIADRFANFPVPWKKRSERS